MKENFSTTVDKFRQVLKDREWHFEEKDGENKYSFTLEVKGEDLPMDTVFIVDYDREMVTGMSFLPITVDEKHRVEMAIGVGMINYLLALGTFDYDFFEGHVLFRLSVLAPDGEATKAQMSTLVDRLFSIVDEYNDILFMLGKGMLSLEQLHERLYAEK